MMPRRTAVPASAETPSSRQDGTGTFSPNHSGSFCPPPTINDVDDVKVVHRETNATTDGQVYFHQIPGPVAGNPEAETSQMQQSDSDLLEQEAVTAMIAANDHHHLCTIPTVQSNNTHLITSQTFPTVQMFPTVMVPQLMVPMSRFRSAILSTVTPTILFDAANYCEPIALISSVIEPNHHHESHQICRQMCSCNATIEPSLQGNIPDQRFLHGVQPQNYDAQRPELDMMTIESIGRLPLLPAGLAIFEQNIPHRRNSISEPRYDRNIQLVEVARNPVPFHLEQSEMTNNVERAGFLPYRTISRYENNLMLPNILSEQRCDLNASSGGIFPQYFDFRRIEQNDLMDSSTPLNQQHHRAKPPYNQMRTFNPSLQNIVPRERHNRHISFRLPQQAQLYSSHHPESNLMGNSENFPVARNQTSQNGIPDYNYIQSCPIVRPPTRYNVPHLPTPNVMRNMIPVRYTNSLNHQHCGSYPRYEQTYSYNPTVQNNALVQKNGRSTLPAQAVDSHCNRPQNVMGNNVQSEQRYQDVQRCGASEGRANLSLQPSYQHPLQVEQRGLSATLANHLPQHFVAEQTRHSCATNSGNIPHASSDHRFGQTMAQSQQQIRKEPRVRTTPTGRRHSKVVPVIPNANQLPVYPVTHNISLVIHPPAPAVGTQPEQQQPPCVAAISVSSNQVPQQTSPTTSNLQYGHLFANSLVHDIKVASISQPVNEPTILIPQLSVANNVSQPVDMSILVPDTQRQQIITPIAPTTTSANSNSGQQSSSASSAGGSSKLTTRNKNSGASKLPKVEDLANDKEEPPVKVRKMGQICPPGGYFLERGNQVESRGSHTAAVADATAASTRRISTGEPSRSENATLTSAMATTSSAQSTFCSIRLNEQRVAEAVTNTQRRKNRSSTSLENEGATSVHSVKSRRRSGYPDSSSNN